MMNETSDLRSDDDSVDWDRLGRYLAGECPPEEIVAVDEWAAQDPENRKLLATLGQILSRFEAAPAADLDVEGALQQVKAKIRAPGVEAISLERERERRMAVRPYRMDGLLRAAAVLFILVGAAFIYRLTAREVAGPVGAGLAQVFTTATGERDSLRLADGTFVLLGPESQLTVAEGFGTEGREVSLRGEAYFDVGTSGAGLFTVLAGGIRIEDLGTAFVVRTGEEAALRVSVTEGSVRVHMPMAPPSDALTLSAGDAADVLAGNLVQQSELMPDVDLEWREGRVRFRETPLSRVRYDLRRWYGIDLRFEDPTLEQRHLTASFENDSVDQVARVISIALGGVADVRGDTIIISPARGATTP